MINIRLASAPSQVWNSPFNLTLYLRSKHDTGFNYVTASTKKAIEAGMFGRTMTWRRFEATYNQGDFFLLQMNGQVTVAAKINSQNKTTMAFHAPRTVEMPRWENGSTTEVIVPAVLLGFTGLNQPPRGDRGAQSPPELEPDILSATVPLPFEVNLAGVKPELRQDFIAFVADNLHLFVRP